MPTIVGTSSKARLISITPNSEKTMAYIARVSSKNQTEESFERLLRYCIKHKHWSVFEHSQMTIEVVCPLAIAVQLIRHKSFSFSQFSGRYQDQREMGKVTEGIGTDAHRTVFKDMFYLPVEARLQDDTNRQNSVASDDPALNALVEAQFIAAYTAALEAYTALIDAGIAKEQARFVLPQGVFTRLYVTGNIRSFIHYIQAREEKGVVQEEHVELANAIRDIFEEELPTVALALGWGEN